jgi:hypothetical protein
LTNPFLQSEGFHNDTFPSAFEFIKMVESLKDYAVHVQSSLRMMCQSWRLATLRPKALRLIAEVIESRTYINILQSDLSFVLALLLHKS